MKIVKVKVWKWKCERMKVWKCESESLKVWKWKCEGLKVKVLKWTCESEKCERVKVKAWKWKCESESMKVEVWKCQHPPFFTCVWLEFILAKVSPRLDTETSHITLLCHEKKTFYKIKLFKWFLQNIQQFLPFLRNWLVILF